MMKIIKDKQIVEDSWVHLADETTLSSGNITVSLTRWKQEQTTLSNYNGDIGIRLTPDDTLDDISTDLNNIPLIALEFPAFTDGRSFSHARLLRERYQFTGEIRAIGNYMLDQVFYLMRVGVNAFELTNTKELNVALNSMSDFSVRYQESIQ